MPRPSQGSKSHSRSRSREKRPKSRSRSRSKDRSHHSESRSTSKEKSDRAWGRWSREECKRRPNPKTGSPAKRSRNESGERDPRKRTTAQKRDSAKKNKEKRTTITPPTNTPPRITPPASKSGAGPPPRRRSPSRQTPDPPRRKAPTRIIVGTADRPSVPTTTTAGAENNPEDKVLTIKVGALKTTRPDTPVPGPPATRLVLTKDTPTSSRGPEEVISLRPLIDYRFGNAFTMAEYLAATLKDRLAQARWYGDIAVNFVGTKDNFEKTAGETRSMTKAKNDNRNKEVIAALWRARLLSCGMAADATMMLCHPAWYAEVIEANQVQPDERLSVADQIKGMRAFQMMSNAIRPRHGAPEASPNLPPLEAWEELQRRPGRGLLMPNGTLLPEAVANQVTEATGMVILHPGIMDKLAEVARLKTSIDELMAMIATESQPPVRSRLGPRVGSGGTAGPATTPSQVRLPKPTSGERSKEDHPQPPPKPITPPPITPPATPSTPPTDPSPIPPTTIPQEITKAPISTEAQTDLEEASKHVQEMEFEDNGTEGPSEAEVARLLADTPGSLARNPATDTDDDCMIIEQCQPIKRENKSPRTQKEEPMEEDEAIADDLVGSVGTAGIITLPSQVRLLEPKTIVTEVLSESATLKREEEDVKIAVIQVATTASSARGCQVETGPPLRGQSQIRPISYRIAGESHSDHETGSEDESFQGAAARRTSGYISPQDQDPDNIEGMGRIKWSKPRPNRKKKKKTTPYTGIPYKQPKDDVAEEHSEVEEDIVETTQPTNEPVVTERAQDQLEEKVPYEQPVDDVQDTVILVPRLDLVGCPEFYEGHLSYPAPMPFVTPQRSCREQLCMARQTWYNYEDYDDLEHNYYDTKTREQATRDSYMMKGTTYDLTEEGRSHRKIYMFGTSSKKTNYVTTNWLRLRNALCKAGFFASIAGTYQVSCDLEAYTTRALNSYAKSEKLTPVEKSNEFSVLHMAAPNGAVVQVRVIWDGREGRQPHGQRIPYELKEILQDPRIRKIGFGIFQDARKLASVGIAMKSVCDIANLVLMAWPQMDKDAPKTGKMFVKKMLSAPCPLYGKNKDKPEKNGIRIDYEVMDFCKPVDQWHWHWSYYNAMDHYLAFGLLDFIAARAADLDGLNMDADVVRYQLAFLDAIRDLPDMGIPRRDGAMAFAIVKEESDEDRELVRPWPIVIDSPIYNSLRVRKEFTDNIIKKHKLDLAHYGERYLNYMEKQMESPMQQWDQWTKQGHGEWFNCTGKMFPHACGSCGSFEHDRDRCNSTDSCEYHYCKGQDHEMVVCPTIMAKCDTCGGLGHKDHGQDSTVMLEANFSAAKNVHIIMARLSNRRLAYKVQRNKATDALEVVEEESPYTKKMGPGPAGRM
jgi:hypothetical protein